MNTKILGIIIVAIVIGAAAIFIISISEYWEEPFSTEGLEGSTGFTILLNFKDGTTENAKLSDSPFEIWNWIGGEELGSITLELAVQASGRNHNTVQIREKSGYDVNIVEDIWVSPPEGYDRQNLSEYEGFLFKGFLSSPIAADTTIEADGAWHTIATVTLGCDTLDNFIEGNIPSTFTVGDESLYILLFSYADANVIEIKSDVMDNWITVDLPSETNTGIAVTYLPPYGVLNWDSTVDVQE